MSLIYYICYTECMRDINIYYLSPVVSVGESRGVRKRRVCTDGQLRQLRAVEAVKTHINVSSYTLMRTAYVSTLLRRMTSGIEGQMSTAYVSTRQHTSAPC